MQCREDLLFLLRVPGGMVLHSHFPAQLGLGAESGCAVDVFLLRVPGRMAHALRTRNMQCLLGWELSRDVV